MAESEPPGDGGAGARTAQSAAQNVRREGRPGVREGVIHDIGYRRYEGPRMTRSQIRRTLTLQGFGDAAGFARSGRARVVPVVLAVLMLLPAFVVVAVVVLAGGDPPIAPERYADALQLVITLFVAAQAPALFSRDLRHRTIVLLLARPPTRTDYVRSRLTALTAAILVFTALPVLVIIVGGLLAGRPVTTSLRELGQACVGLVLLSLLLACVGGVVAALTPRRGVAVAAITAVLLISSSTVTVVGGIVRAQRGPGAPALDYVSLGSPYRLTEQIQALVGAPDRLLTLPALVHVGVYAVLVAGCLALLAHRYATIGRT